jgi:multiple sugar transport system substrate-binding protein/raffinose/stachyose/melibiose transport system substrate-binding protein
VATPLDHESFKASIGDTLKTGNPPDLYSYWAGAKTKALIGELQPLDGLWKTARLDKAFSPALVDSACRYGSSIYLLPITQHFVGIFYNKALFAAAGISPPLDWPSFLAACAALKARGILPLALGADAKWPAQFWFDYLLLRTAGPEYRERLMEGQASWTDPEVKRVFSMWRDLLSAGYFNPNPNEIAWDSDAAKMVAEGGAAMTLMGTWITGAWQVMGLDWQEGRDYGVFPFPVIDPATEGCALGPVDGLVVPKDAKNAAGAMRVLAYLAGSEPQAAMSKGSGALAPNLGVDPSSYTPLQRQVLDYIAAAPHWAFNYDLATPPEHSRIGLELFVEFLAFPDHYPSLLARTEERMRGLDSP